MNKLLTLIAAGGLMAMTQQTYACPGNAHGPNDACPTKGGMMQHMDKDGDGAISKQEFTAFHEEKFKALDVNQDGKITNEEMASLHHGMHGDNKTAHQMNFERHFDAADTNHDGALSKEEAREGMPMLFARFDEKDANKDGKISKDEVMRGHDGQRRKP